MKNKQQWLILLMGVLLLVTSNALTVGFEEQLDLASLLQYLAVLAVGIGSQFSSAMLIGQSMQQPCRDWGSPCGAFSSPS